MYVYFERYQPKHLMKNTSKHKVSILYRILYPIYKNEIVPTSETAQVTQLQKNFKIKN